MNEIIISDPTQHNIPNLPSSSSHNAVDLDKKPRKNKWFKLVKIESSQFPTSSSTTISRPKYSKKPDPGAPKITRPCTECGKKFWSWKALFGHMRCHPERQWRGINPPPNHRQPASPVNWTNIADASITDEDHEIASSLLMLANGATATESECGKSYRTRVQENDTFGANSDANFNFECLSCKKVFGSHQALGGHRASHKNVKGCFAITRSGGCDVEDQGGDDDLTMDSGHQCSICLRVFSSGQALGGHKRCHWEKRDALNPLAEREDCCLDLNLPAPVDNNNNNNISSSCSSGLALDLRLGL